MSRFFLRLLGFILLLSTMGLATCQSLVKADPSPITTETLQQTWPGSKA